MRLGLKVDVDTWAGLREGVPALLGVLEERGIKASFFVALGPDNSGRAIFRVWRQRGFLAKMLRTKAPSLYGPRTMLYGTLLRAPLIGEQAGQILPQVAAAGHEVGLHGWDHVGWHDGLLKMKRVAIEQEVAQAQEVFARLLGCRALAFAAPGWQDNLAALEVLAAQGFRYASNTRGAAPYWPRFGDRIAPLLEIPTTLPTLDELLGFNGCGAEDFHALIFRRLERRSPQVHTVHAEVEGGPYLDEFSRFLDRCREAQVTFFRLGDFAAELLSRPDDLCTAPVWQGRLPGRAGTVSRQGAEEAAA